MIQLVNASKSYGDQVLLREESWWVAPGDRIGLVGPNGAGKSTLLKILAGIVQADDGEVVRAKRCRVGYLPQEGVDPRGRTLFEAAREAFSDLLRMRAEQDALAERLADPGDGDPDVLARYGELEEEWQRRGGYELDARIGEVLGGLGFAAEDRERPVSDFSQGWRMRIALARLLLEANDVILLDEPTNYLDIEARAWLLGFLGRHRGGLVLVAHDRYFLDQVVTRITEIGFGRLLDYPGGFTRYQKRRAEEIAELRKRAAEQDAEIERHKRFIGRFRYQANRARLVQSRIKMLEKIERIEAPPEHRKARLRLPKSPRSGRVAATLSGVRKAFGENVVYRGLDLVVERGERLALIGPNGSGKSTLVRLLAGVETPDAGERTLGHNVRIAWYGSDDHDLDPDRTVHETMTAAAPLSMLPEIRNILGAFLFSGDSVDKKTAVLSGGERSRLALARLFLRPANLLLLDEPTNHLDLDAKAALLEAVAGWQGAIVFVAHDRHFMDALATRVAVVGEGEAALYWGNYSDWLARSEQAASGPGNGAGARPSGNGGARRDVRGSGASGPGRPVLSRNRRRRLEEAFHAAFEAAADAEAALESLEERMAAPGFYENDRPGAERVVAEHRELKSRLPGLHADLERAEERLRAVGLGVPGEPDRGVPAAR